LVFIFWMDLKNFIRSWWFFVVVFLVLEIVAYLILRCTTVKMGFDPGLIYELFCTNHSISENWDFVAYAIIPNLVISYVIRTVVRRFVK